MLAPHFSHFSVPPAAGDALLRALRATYRVAPFHNWFHAVGVLHGAWLLLGTPALTRALPPPSQLALLLAALGHDAGHTGRSNSLELALRTPIATRYGARGGSGGGGGGLLERLHAATLRGALEDSGVLCALPEDGERAALLDAVEGAVLHTDMDTHSETVAALEAWARGWEGGSRAPPPPEPLSLPPARLALLLGAVLHAADIGSLCYDAPVALAWTARVQEEFRAQAAAEAALGLPVSPHMRGLRSNALCARAQVEFIENFVAPLWTALKSVVDGPLGGGGGLEQPMANLARSLALFKERAAAEG
jgi:hypothetical protein